MTEDFGIMFPCESRTLPRKVPAWAETAVKRKNIDTRRQFMTQDYSNRDRPQLTAPGSCDEFEYCPNHVAAAFANAGAGRQRIGIKGRETGHAAFSARCT